MRQGLEHIIGAINATHISINRPHSEQLPYCNRKGTVLFCKELLMTKNDSQIFIVKTQVAIMMDVYLGDLHCTSFIGMV